MEKGLGGGEISSRCFDILSPKFHTQSAIRKGVLRIIERKGTFSKRSSLIFCGDLSPITKQLQPTEKPFVGLFFKFLSHLKNLGTFSPDFFFLIRHSEKSKKKKLVKKKITRIIIYEAPNVFKVFTVMLTSTESQYNNSPEEEGCIIHFFIGKETKPTEAKPFDQSWLMCF